MAWLVLLSHGKRLGRPQGHGRPLVVLIKAQLPKNQQTKCTSWCLQVTCCGVAVQTRNRGAECPWLVSVSESGHLELHFSNSGAPMLFVCTGRAEC